MGQVDAAPYTVVAYEVLPDPYYDPRVLCHNCLVYEEGDEGLEEDYVRPLTAEELSQNAGADLWCDSCATRVWFRPGIG